MRNVLRFVQHRLVLQQIHKNVHLYYRKPLSCVRPALQLRYYGGMAEKHNPVGIVEKVKNIALGMELLGFIDLRRYARE